MNAELRLKITKAKRSGASSLDLSSQQLEQIPDDIYKIFTLEYLDLSHNLLLDIEGIGKLKTLKNLDISDNKISVLAKSILDLKELQFFKFDKNPFSASFNETQFSGPSVIASIQNILNMPGPGYNLELDEKQINNPAYLRKVISDILQENKLLKNHNKEHEESEESKLSMAKKNFNIPSINSNLAEKDKQQIKLLEEELQKEKIKNQKLANQYEIAQNQIAKLSSSNISAFQNDQIQGVTEIDVKDLVLNKQISQGGFSVVWKGSWKHTQVAIKRIFETNLTDTMMEEVKNELLMMAILRHPNVILLMGASIKQNDIAIVMEYSSMSLFTLLHNSTAELKEITKLKIAKEIAGAYCFLHTLGIVHRDLKSHNVLMFDNYHIKICDFGLAKFKADLLKGSNIYSGTPSYMSPEIYSHLPYDEKIDIFAYGTLLWEMFARQIPYDGLEPAQIMAKVKSETELPPIYGSNKVLVDLIKQCRKINPKERPSMEIINNTLEGIIKLEEDKNS